MEIYSDRGLDSGITHYEIGHESIAIRFRHGGTYVYTSASAGGYHIQNMQKLARQGDGLNAYINDHVSDRYAYKE